MRRRRAGLYEDPAWIKEQWPGRRVVKVVQTVADAKRLADMGVDGITPSSHGGLRPRSRDM